MKENSIIKKIYSRKTITRLEKKVILLGKKDQFNVLNFLLFRLFSALSIFFVIIILIPFGYIIAPLITLVYYKGLEYFLLDYQINKRERKLESEALYFFEILLMTLENASNIKEAIKVSASSINSDIAKEFKKALEEVALGKTLNEALIAMKERIPSGIVKDVILNLINANIYGSNIENTLTNQIDYLQDKRTTYFKGEISKLPIKLSIVSVILFIPIILLIVISPVIINLIIK